VNVSTGLTRIVALLAAGGDYRLRIAPQAITATTRFKEDLGFDSMAVMSLAYELQEIYPELDEMAIASWVTVGDCARYVEALVSFSPSPVGSGGGG